MGLVYPASSFVLHFWVCERALEYALYVSKQPG